MAIEVPTRDKFPVDGHDVPFLGKEYELAEVLDVYDVLLALAARRFETWDALVEASGVSRTTLWRAAKALREGRVEVGMELAQALRLTEAVGARVMVVEVE